MKGNHLNFNYAMTHEQIAEVMGITPTGVRWIEKTAIEKIRKRYGIKLDEAASIHTTNR